MGKKGLQADNLSTGTKESGAGTKDPVRSSTPVVSPLFYRNRIVMLKKAVKKPGKNFRAVHPLLWSFSGKAFTAINGTIVARLERHLCGHAAFSADRVMHFALSWSGFATIATASSRVAAVAATRRLVLKPFLGVEFLLSRREDEV